MFHKVKLIMPAAVAPLAGALLAGPALAQRTGGAITGGGNVSAGSSISAPPGGGYRGGSVSAARGSGPARIGGNPNYAYNGRHHHHHRDHGGHFGFGFIRGPYDYDNSWPNSWAYEPDCYLRRVHIHHHWVLRRYCC